jgi:hypothetical protein
MTLSLIKRYREESPGLTDAQIRHYIDQFDRLKNDPKIKEKDIAKYSFVELEHVIDSNFLIRPTSRNIDDEPIYRQGSLTVWEAGNREECVAIGRGESWCVSRTDASNMYNSYRYRMNEPHFYFVKDSSKDDSDKWSFFVVMPFANGTFGLASRANTQPFSGSEEYSWEEVIKHAPALKSLRRLFATKPLTDEEKTIANLVSKQIDVPDLLKHFKKLSLVEHYIGWLHELSNEQFVNLTNKELRMKYINTGNKIKSDDAFNSMSDAEMKRYFQICVESSRNKNLDLSYINRLRTGIKFPREIDGDLRLDTVEHIGDDIEFPEVIGGSMFIDMLVELPQNTKLPKYIRGDLIMDSCRNINGCKLPDQIIGYLRNGRIKDFSDVTFPWVLGGLNIPACEKLPDTVVFLDSTEKNIRLPNLIELPNNFKLPFDQSGKIDLSMIKMLPDNFRFPLTCDDVHLSNLREMPKNLQLPMNMGRLYFSDFIRTLPEGFKFPKRVSEIFIQALSMLPDNCDYPKQSGRLYFNSLPKKYYENLPERLRTKIVSNV